MHSTGRAVANFIGFYLGWAACVVGAARGLPWLGPLLAVVLLSLHCATSAAPAAERRTLLAAAVLGWAVDTGMASAGLFAFAGTSPYPWLSPPWMVSLWALFAATLDGPLAWLTGRYRLAAVVGGVGGPLSYAAGAGLGAIAVTPPSALALAAIAVVWAAALPALLGLRARARRPFF